MNHPDHTALVERLRRRHTDKPDEWRSGFQRDRDRIIYSEAFRRLGGVTQVISSIEGHVYHNRLTHTIKVAQVARRVAERLITQGGELAADEGLAPPALDADVTETAALAHDLGHPPFGHVGEMELQRLIQPLDPVDDFEGNAQSFRIVTRVSRNQLAFAGLNLTRATLLAILKYPWLHDADDAKAAVKWGAYTTEIDDFRFAKSLGTDDALPVSGEPQSLEAQVMDWADDIAYAVHDVEDLFRAGLIPLDQLYRSPDARGEFAQWVASRWVREDREVPAADIDLALSQILAFLGVGAPFEGTADQRARLRMFASFLTRRYVEQTYVLLEVGADGQGVWSIDVPASYRLEVEVLKQLTWRYVIEKPSLAAQRHGHKAVVRGLFEVYMDAADSNRSHAAITLLPARVREEVALIESSADADAARARIVCDAICSMSDDEAMRMHARLSGHTMGSIFDPIV